MSDEDIKSREQRIALEAEIKGMERARSIVLRRTEIPRVTKNPISAIVVSIGDACARVIARIISDDIAVLKQEQERQK